MFADLAELRSYISGTPPLPALLLEARARLDDDPGHDLEHALRVALWTVRLAGDEVPARLSIAAALFHDVVNLPKDHPERALASTRSAELATTILEAHGFSADETAAVHDAIRDHSYSRGAVPTATLGRALQDADRLEALGVLGVFRTISTGSRMGAAYFHPDDPWGTHRSLDDRRYSIDHFAVKLFRLASTMCTEAGRTEARRRAARMLTLLESLGDELGVPFVPPADLAAELARLR